VILWIPPSVDVKLTFVAVVCNIVVDILVVDILAVDMFHRMDKTVVEDHSLDIHRLELVDHTTLC
jgi:hypothetical protein